MRRLPVVLPFLFAAALGACGDDASPTGVSSDAGGVDTAGPGGDVAPGHDATADVTTPGGDVSDGGPRADGSVPGPDAPDVGGSDAGDAGDPGTGDADAGPIGPPPEEGDRVVIDLTPYLGDAAGQGTYARVIEDEADLVGGEASTGRTGDVLIGNEHVRFVVQGPSRAIGVCPYGGGLIDGDIVRPAGEPSRDAIGAVCLFLNVGKTMDAKTIEILSDGADGGPAVLAVTGLDETLDFLNLKGAIAQWVGIPLDFAVDPDTDLPVTITTYYIVRPDDRGVRMVTAVRNDGADVAPVIFGELIDSGGVVEFFNPSSSLKGFGYGGFGEEKMDFLSFKADHTTHTYAPPPLPDGRLGAGYLVISGVAGVILGSDDPLGALLGGANAPPHEARHQIDPGAVVTVERWVFLGDGAVSSTTDPLWKERGVATGHIAGLATEDGGGPVGGARISVVDGAGRTLTQMVSAPDGTFEADVPAGSYTLRAIADGRIAEAGVAVDVEAGAIAEPALGFTLPGALQVHVTNPAGEPIPAKITVKCDGPCAVTPTAQDRDVTIDFNFQGAIVPLGPSGEATIPLPPGTYRVVASRGPTCTLWPADYDPTTNPGVAITVEPGATVDLSPVIARAVDTTGWLSGDFHVHAVNSPDAPVHNLDRVKSFLSEGIDVLVSTDHDFITDYAPYVAELGAGELLATVVGVELTTFDYGHFNAFPLVRDPESRNGGAVDWAGGPGYSLKPDAIFDALHAFPGEQVVQVNHANSGYFFATKVDAATSMTFANPAPFRMEPTPPDPVTGDTGLWSDKFTAMELYNGFSQSSLWANMNWWLTFLNRGFRVAGTAVTDTHKLIKDPGGLPCTWVSMPDGADVIVGLDQQLFATQVNAGRIVGSNGPVVDARLVDPATGDEVGIGGTLALGAPGPVKLEVTIQTPVWFATDRIEIFSNATTIVTPPGQLVEQKPPVATTVDFELTDADLLPAFEGGAPGMRWQKTVTVDLEPTEDAYYVVLVTGNKPSSKDLRPVVGATKALAFTNPLFVDVAGDGWTPPVDASKLVPPLPPAVPPPLPPVPATRAHIEKALDEARAHSCHGGYGMTHAP